MLFAFIGVYDAGISRNLLSNKRRTPDNGDCGWPYLRPGDVILSANGYTARSRQDWELALSLARASLLQLKLRRDKKVVYLKVQLQ